MSEEETPYSVGTLVAHCSEHEGPADVGIALQLSGGRQLWCGEITRQRWNEAVDANGDAALLGEDDGWWIILYSKEEAQVIGKCIDQYVASDMMDALAVALLAPEEGHMVMMKGAADE
jgi:hypothetical protein